MIVIKNPFRPMREARIKMLQRDKAREITNDLLLPSYIRKALGDEVLESFGNCLERTVYQALSDERKAVIEECINIIKHESVLGLGIQRHETMWDRGVEDARKSFAEHLRKLGEGE